MIRINLLKPERKDLKETPSAPAVEVTERSRQPLFALILVVAVAAIGLLFVFQRNELAREQKRLDEAKEEKQSLQYVIAKLDELERQKDTLRRKITLIMTLRAQQPSAVIIMDELSKHLPEWVWLTEAAYSGNSIRLKGQATSNSLLADYIFNLKQSRHFAGVNLISSTQRRTKNYQYLEFSLTVTFVPPRASVETTNTLGEGRQE